MNLKLPNRLWSVIPAKVHWRQLSEYYSPFCKGGLGGFKATQLEIPLNSPFEKGDFSPNTA